VEAHARPSDDHRHSIINPSNVTNPPPHGIEVVQPNSQYLLDFIRYLTQLLPSTAVPYRRPIKLNKPETNRMAQEHKLGVAVLGVGRMGKRHALNVRFARERDWLHTPSKLEIDGMASGVDCSLDSILLP